MIAELHALSFTPYPYAIFLDDPKSALKALYGKQGNYALCHFEHMLFVLATKPENHQSV